MTAADTSTHVLVVPEKRLPALESGLRAIDGVTVTVTETAAEARERVTTDTVDSVVVGHSLPDDDGVALTSDLSDADGQLPVVMVTAAGDGQVASDALAAGATDYVQVTPDTVDSDAVVTRILESLNGAGGKGAREERERAEYETILETIPVGVFVLDADNDILRVNRKATELVGLDRETALSKSVPDLIADGVFGADIVDQYEEFLPDLLSESTDATAGSFQFTAFPGEEERVYEATLTPRPYDETFRGTIGVFRDITDRLEREERLETQRAQLADRTAQLERQNERLDEFASMVSHELRNPLNTAQGHLKLGRRKEDEAHFETAASALDRMEAMIDDILTLTRQGKTVTDTQPVELAAVVQQSWRAIDAPRATLQADLEATVLADPARIRQLFENLFRNAVEHGSTNPDSRARQDSVEHGGTAVTIEVGSIPEGAPETAPLEGFYVADDGPGIPEADRGTVFEKGFTTAPGGTGFGLSIVGSVAEAHGWTVEITDSAGSDRLESADGGRVQPDAPPDERATGGGACFEITGVATPEAVSNE